MKKGKQPHQVLIVDDSPTQCLVWKAFMESRYGDHIKVDTFNNPLDAFPHFKSSVSLLVIDWIMPHMDGKQVLAEAKKRGVDSKKIIMVSIRSADLLHENFKPGECLAVIEKNEPSQLGALLQILDEMFIPV